MLEMTKELLGSDKHMQHTTGIGLILLKIQKKKS